MSSVWFAKIRGTNSDKAELRALSVATDESMARASIIGYASITWS
jgi:hypothetical protein